MNKENESSSLKKQLLGLADTPKAHGKGGSGYTATALMKNYASPRDLTIFDGEEIAERELRIRTEITRYGMERRGKPVFLTPSDTKLSLYLSTCLNTHDPDIAEFIRWTERAEEFGLKEAGNAPNPIARTFSLRELAKAMYKRSKKAQIEQIREGLKRLRETEQTMHLGQKNVRIKSSLIMREYAVEDLSPEERGLDEERIVFGTIFLWNMKKRFAYISPKAWEVWGRRGSGTENQLFSILFSTLHSLCFNHQLTAIKARKNLRIELNSDEYKDLSKEEKNKLYQERVEDRVKEALTHKENISYLKSRIPTDYDSDRRYKSKFIKDFNAAIEALKEIGIITYGAIHKGKGKRGQDMAIFIFNECYKEQKELPSPDPEEED